MLPMTLTTKSGAFYRHTNNFLGFRRYWPIIHMTMFMELIVFRFQVFFFLLGVYKHRKWLSSSKWLQEAVYVSESFKVRLAQQPVVCCFLVCNDHAVSSYLGNPDLCSTRVELINSCLNLGTEQLILTDLKYWIHKSLHCSVLLFLFFVRIQVCVSC